MNPDLRIHPSTLKGLLKLSIYSTNCKVHQHERNSIREMTKDQSPNLKEKYYSIHCIIMLMAGSFLPFCAKFPSSQGNLTQKTSENIFFFLLVESGRLLTVWEYSSDVVHITIFWLLLTSPALNQLLGHRWLVNVHTNPHMEYVLCKLTEDV